MAIRVVVRAFLVRHVVWPFRLLTITIVTTVIIIKTPITSNSTVMFRVGREGRGFLVVFTLGYLRKTLLRFPSFRGLGRKE